LLRCAVGASCFERAGDLNYRWMEHAACLDRTDLPWIVDRPGASERLEMAAVCASCPVLAECQGFAIRARVTAGFWAGAARGDLRNGTVGQESTDSRQREAGGAA
jgi:hypothetical protein